jgi:glucose/arabinose dehydrogenase
MGHRRIGWVCLLAVVLTSPAWALTNPIPKGTITISLQAFANISTSSIGTPQDLIPAPDGSGRLFVAHRNGVINLLNSQTGALIGPAFLNMGSAGVPVYTGGEGGFLGLALSPDYNTSRRFYTYTTETFSTSGPAADFSPPEMFPTTAVNPTNQIVLREWTTSAANPNLANTTSRVLLRMNHPQSNHQGGGLRFGPDGNLYLAIGDGGEANDYAGSPSSNTDGHNNAVGNAQDLTIPLGKILRINPNPAAGPGFITSTNGQYSIPATNPFSAGAGGAVREVFAYGLRNPFKITFDTANGNLIAADVGQGQREEVNFIANGGNYGWVFREGTRNNTEAGRPVSPGFASIDPFAEYTHVDGRAVIGGEVYHGGLVPGLDGKYVFGDLNLTFGGVGRLFYTDPANGSIFEFNYAPGSMSIPAPLYGVHAGAGGELYALFSNGSILRVTPIPEPATALLLGVAGTGLLLRRRK